MVIRRTVVDLWRFNGFSKWRPSTILDLLWACLDHPQRVFGGTYHCTEFRCNRFNSFDNMQMLIFNESGLKMPIHTPKLEFLGVYAP